MTPLGGQGVGGPQTDCSGYVDNRDMNLSLLDFSATHIDKSVSDFTRLGNINQNGQNVKENEIKGHYLDVFKTFFLSWLFYCWRLQAIVVWVGVNGTLTFVNMNQQTISETKMHQC